MSQIVISMSDLSVNEIKDYITRINELDTCNINSYMPIDKLTSSQRQSLFKQFNKYIPIHIKPKNNNVSKLS